MGTDKAMLKVEGAELAPRAGAVLAAVTAPALEAGPGRSGLPVVPEPFPGQGPMVALAAAWTELSARGHLGPVVVLACDLPLVDEPLLRLLASWPTSDSVVPVVDGHPQPLCARLSPAALDLAAVLASAPAAGPRSHRSHRSLRSLLAATPVTWLGPAEWGPVASPRSFADVDRPTDLDALGLRWSPA